MDYGMIKALGMLVDLMVKLCKHLKVHQLETQRNSVKSDLLEMHTLLNDTISSAEKSISQVGDRRTISELQNIEIEDITDELVIQLSRLHRINEIIRDNDLINIETSLKYEFEKLIKWKEGVLFGYGATIQFSMMFGYFKSESSSLEQQRLDLYRFCFLNSEPNELINKEELEDNISNLKKSLENLENAIRIFLTSNEVIDLSQEAMVKASKYSTASTIKIK